MILLEAGDNDSAETWQQVMGAFGEETLTCAYDRAGLGTSDDAVGCRGLDEILGDLDALLAAAELSGPFVLVGHSGGGFLMAGFAERHPEDVSGLVLVETPKALTIVPPGLLDLLKCDHPANVEHRDYYGIEHEVWDDRTQIGEFPVTVISNDWGPDAPPDDTATNVEDQQGWFVLSPNSKQVIVTTGHHVPRDEPDVVIREVLAVLDAARAP